MSKGQIKKMKELAEISLPPDVYGYNVLYSSGRQFSDTFHLVAFFIQSCCRIYFTLD